MTSIVVTGTGLLTAAGLGHDPLERALESGRCFVEPRADGLRCSRVSTDLIAWPEAPEWQAAREYAGLGSQLAVAACQQALGAALQGTSAFDTARAATIAVTGDDWSGQQVFDRALVHADSTRGEARALFTELDDQFLLRTFRWGVGMGMGALSGFQGASAEVDYPSFGGLSGLLHAVHLIESGEVDAVMLAGVDTIPRLDVVAALQALASAAGKPALDFGQGAAAVLLERSSSARARGASPLARILSCKTLLDEESAPAAPRLDQELGAAMRFTSAPALGTLLSAGALVDLCLASQWLARERGAGRSSAAAVAATETYWASGAAAAALSCERDGQEN